tara:strand:- start:236 stop:604 length:369 start_codon:yes stop_codon:yes gene_type:complete
MVEKVKIKGTTIEELKEKFGAKWEKEYAKILKDPNRLKKQYNAEVRKLTKLVQENVVGYKKDLHSFKGYNIDHKISIEYGWLNKIAPGKIAHISNLQFITNKENGVKSAKCKIDDSNKWILE